MCDISTVDKTLLSGLKALHELGYFQPTRQHCFALKNCSMPWQSYTVGGAT